MTTVTSIADGNWSAAGTWDTGSKPISGNDVVIKHTVTGNEVCYAKSIKVSTSGDFKMQNNVVLDDSGLGDNYMWIEDDATGCRIDTASHIIIKSASTSPTYPITVHAESVSGEDTRNLDFEGVEIQGSDYTLYASTYMMRWAADVPNTTAGRITSITPITRDIILRNFPCAGRGYSRIRQNGLYAGIMTVSGFLRIDQYATSNYGILYLNTLINTKARCSFFSRYNHLPRCRVERLTFGSPRGFRVPFTMTLVEDR